MSTDDPTPDGLNEIEQRLREGRAELTPLQADELRRRIVQSSASRPRRRRFRGAGRRGLVTVLVAGALGTTGASAVLASTSLGGSLTSLLPSTYNPPTTDKCQYHQSWTRTLSFSKSGGTLTITIAYDCKTNKFTITITCSKPITSYYCNGKLVTLPASTKTTTIVLTPGSQSLSITSGAGTFSVPLFLSA